MAGVPTSALPTESGSNKDDLGRIFLRIRGDQLVGVPLRGDTAELLLLDDQNNPLPEFNLNDTPIVLSPASGSLFPDRLDDSVLIDDNGLIDLLPLGITYSGPTGSIAITASDLFGNISDETTVNFSGYDIIGATFSDGSIIDNIYLGVPTSILVTVRNSGSLEPINSGGINRPAVLSLFTGGAGSVKRTFDGHNNGVIDTLSFRLPDITSPTGPDTLLLVLSADFTLDGNTHTTTDTLRIAVTVLPPPSLAVLPGSVTPDSAYAGVDFRFGFDAEIIDLSGTIDSTPTTVRLINQLAGPTVDTILLATNPAFTQSGNLLEYRNLRVSGADLPSDAGWYRVEFDYQVVSSIDNYIIRNVDADSIYLDEAPVP
ncbi:MAG: hypothetical protein V3T31_08065, partial [candidate division Zixibacteria bacterium]